MIAPDSNPAIMLFYDPESNRKPKAGAGLLGSEKGIKNFLYIRGRDSGSCV